MIKTIHIKLDNYNLNNDNRQELRRLIGYVSEQIISIVIEDKSVTATIDGSSDEELLKGKILSVIRKYRMLPKQVDVYYENNVKTINWTKRLDYIRQDDYGFVYFSDCAVKLLDVFDGIFEKMALALGAQKRKYPVLLPVEPYMKTGYLQRSPEHAILCSNLSEEIDLLSNISTTSDLRELCRSAQYALSPSACFHLYYDIQGSILQSPSSFTMKQNVFRNEGRFSWNEFGRLRDYTVRELVFVGDPLYVQGQLAAIREQIANFLREIGLQSRIVTSADMFVLPKIQKIKDLQLFEKSKYEVKISYDDCSELACASLNYHGTAFSSPFSFSVCHCEKTVSGCVGFGLERWVMTFLSQYGTDISHWPAVIKENYEIIV